MQKSKQKIIEYTIKACDLDEKEKADLRKELESHFFEAERNLNLKGMSEKYAVRDYGDPKVIGKYIKKAHRKYEHIPVLGYLIYYPPFRNSIKLIIAQVLVFFNYPLVAALYLMVYGDYKANIYQNIMGISFLLVPLTIISFSGSLSYKRFNFSNSFLVSQWLSLFYFLAAICLYMLLGYYQFGYFHKPFLLYPIGFTIFVNFIYSLSYLLTKISYSIKEKYA